MSVTIRPAVSKGDLDAVRALFGEYTDMLGLDLSFQDYAAELDHLPGKYAPPSGRLYLAFHGGEPAGCIALRPVDGGGCEMKRLYVRPQCRGLHIGSLLVEQVIRDAEQMGCDHMLLDTLPMLDRAVQMYQGMGFYEIPPYYHNPVAGAIYMRLDLPRG